MYQHTYVPVAILVGGLGASEEVEGGCGRGGRGGAIGIEVVTETEIGTEGTESVKTSLPLKITDSDVAAFVAVRRVVAVTDVEVEVEVGIEVVSLRIEVEIGASTNFGAFFTRPRKIN